MDHEENQVSGGFIDADESPVSHEKKALTNYLVDVPSTSQLAERDSCDKDVSQSNTALLLSGSCIQSTPCIACHGSLPTTRPARPCLKCQSVTYCSRECQKADFKRHKKVCATAAQAYAREANFRMESRNSGSTSRGAREGHRGGIQKWQYDT